MGILSWIVMGILAGALAKIIMPGKDGGGLLITMLLGIAGAFVGGFVGGLVGLGGTGSFSLATLLTATGGALVLLYLHRVISK